MQLLLLLVITVCVRAGTVQGVVMEHASGRPLARTVVRLDPVPKSAGPASQPLLTRTGRSGHFVFPSVPPGLYLLTALREAYFPAAYGQRLPAGRGVPISISTDSTLIVELRMRHKGDLTGRVLDENGVGTPRVPVVAYRALLPLRSVGGATADDRGVFRIAGLEPDKYWVRSGANTLEDGTGWLPTFSPQGREVRNARHVDIEVWRAGSGLVTDIPVKLVGRRQNLSETGNAVEIQGLRTTLAPGHWEFRALIPDGYYVDSIANVRTARQGRSNAERSSSGFDMFIDPRRPPRIRVTVSDQAGKVTGSVSAEGKPTPGAPVFLWPVADSARRSLGGPLQLVADTEGNFHFDNLPPGDYRVLASFDVNEMDDELAESSNAPMVQCKARQSATIDLPLWMAAF